MSKDENITFIEVMKKAIVEHLVEAKPTTIKTLSARCNRFVNHFKNKKLLDVTPQDVRNLYNPLKANGQLATLKRINQMAGIFFQALFNLSSHKGVLSYDGYYEK